MPWIKGDKANPDLYVTPFISDDVVLGKEDVLERAKGMRKELGQLREGLLAVQKEIGREDRENAKELGQMASELLKDFRGIDFVIKYMEGHTDYIAWNTNKIQEEIAPYADRYFGILSWADFTD